MNDIYLPDNEPCICEIVPYYITTKELDPDVSWIRGELILRVNCTDGIVVIVYQKREE